MKSKPISAELLLGKIVQEFDYKILKLLFWQFYSHREIIYILLDFDIYKKAHLK